MTQKERLVELLKDFHKPTEDDDWDKEELEIYRDEEAVKETEAYYDELADFFLSNGVIVPPCKVGDTLYAMWYRPISKKYFITPIVVEGMVFEKDDWYITTSNDGCFFGDLLNVDWFITQGAAEQALKERNDENSV